MFRNDGKADGLSRDPNGPILQQQCIMSNIMNILFQSFFQGIVIDHGFDQVSRWQPHERCADKAIKDNLFRYNLQGVFGSKH
jgi:hypothetical protein